MHNCGYPLQNYSTYSSCTEWIFLKIILQKFTSSEDIKSSLNMCHQNCSSDHLHACIFKISILQFIKWNRENFRFISNFLPWFLRKWRIMLSREPFKTTALFPQQLPFTYTLKRMDAIGCLSAKNNLLCFHPFSKSSSISLLIGSHFLPWGQLASFPVAKTEGK